MPDLSIIAKGNSIPRYKCIYAYFSDLGAVLVHIWTEEMLTITQGFAVIKAVKH